MLDKLLGVTAHKYLQVLGTFIVAVGLPLNKVVMSIGTIWLAANLLLAGNFKAYWKRWKQHPVFWFISAIFLIHVIGLLYSTDIDYGLRDIKTKLPFFVIPLSLIAFPLAKRYIHITLKCFLASLLITSIINWFNMFYLSVDGEVISFRDASLFGSHIRYGLLIVMGIIVSFYFLLKDTKHFYIWIPLVLWFIYYTLIAQVLSGYIAFIFVLIGSIIYTINTLKKPFSKWISYSVFILIVIFSGISVFNYFSPSQHPIVFGELEERTLQGNKYYHDTTFYWLENGNHVMSYISEVELKKEWNKRSEKPYETIHSSGHKLKATLFRYMTSKNLKKDSVGVHSLTDQDIKNIEGGMTNVKNSSNAPFKRFETLKNQIQNYSVGGDPDGNSLLERFEHWKAAIYIIKENWLFGVGTGDTQEAFNQAYLSTNTKLNKEHWNRAHNQFLTFWVSFGVLGFIIFIACWKYLFYIFWRRKNFLGFCFSFIIVSSFLSEDTLETQQGVTFAALFIGLLLGLNQETYSNEPFKKS